MLIHYCCILYLILYLLLVFNDLLTINSTNADIDRLTQVVQFQSESVRPFSINASPALRVAESRNPDQLSQGGSHPGQVTGSSQGHIQGQTTTLCPRLRTVLESARCSRLWTVVGCWRNIQTPTSKRESNPCPCCCCGATELTIVPPSCPQFCRELFNMESK